MSTALMQGRGGGLDDANGVSAMGMAGCFRRRGAIVLVVFGRVGVGIGELRIFELVDVVEKHRWS